MRTKCQAARSSHHSQNAPASMRPSPSGSFSHFVAAHHRIDIYPVLSTEMPLVLAVCPPPLIVSALSSSFRPSTSGIRALESIPPSDSLSFEDAFCSNIIVDSAVLADAITDIEWWGEDVSLSMSTDEPIQFETCCAYGRCSIRMNASSDVFSRVAIHPSSPSCSYKVHLLKQFSKSLGLSNRTGITLSSKGFSPSAFLRGHLR